MNYRWIAALALASCSSTAPLPNLEDTRVDLDEPLVVELQDARIPVVLVQFSNDSAAGYSTLRMVVDSGAEMSILSKKRAEGMGLYVAEFDGQGKMSGSAGESMTVTHYAAVQQMKIGALAARSFHVTVIDSPALDSEDFGGILGQDLLGRFATIIDMEQKQLHLLPVSAEQQDISDYLSKARVANGTWRVEEVDDRPCPFLPLHPKTPSNEPHLELEIDTGAVTTSLPQEACDRMGLVSIGQSPRVGIDGAYQTDVYSSAQLGFMGYDLEMEFTSSQLPHGLLGMDVLGEFVFVLDGPGKRLWLHHRTVEPKGD